MRTTILVALLLVVLAGPAGLGAQALDSAEPFKVGTFEIDGAATVALVLRDALIVDIGAGTIRRRPNRKRVRGASRNRPPRPRPSRSMRHNSLTAREELQIWRILAASIQHRI